MRGEGTPPSQFIYSERGREGTADGRSRSSRRRGDGYSYSMKNRRPFTLRLTPNG